MNEILLDELCLISGFRKEIGDSRKEITTVLISDHSQMADFFELALLKDKAVKKVLDLPLTDARYDGARLGDPDEAPEEIGLSDLADYAKISPLDVYIMLDTRVDVSPDEQNAVLGIIEKAITDLTAFEGVKRIMAAPDIIVPSAPHGECNALAERELDYLYSEENIPGTQYYLELEKICRTAVRDHGADITLVRMSNVFGPGVDMITGFSMEELNRSITLDKNIVIRDEDAALKQSVLYIRDALKGIHLARVCGKKGHVYNLGGYRAAPAFMKQTAHDLFPEKAGLNASVGTVQEESRCLSDLKISRLAGVSKSRGYAIKSDNSSLSEAIYRTIAYYADIPYDMRRVIPVYNDRLERIKALELETLQFVDKICRENDIKYFLAGGSLLGAIRHKAIIPWDDDLDIGMLREDFEKFRKVCPPLTNGRFTYESPQNDSGSHYQFDKIRLKDTYFSTNYSSRFTINDGIFLDVIIYDQTSNNRQMSELHIFLVDMWTKALNIRWRGELLPGKSTFRFVKAKMLQFLKLFPYKMYHDVFERLVRLYENKSDAEYLIDGIGQNIRKGRFPKKWLTKTRYVDFQGIKAPVPIGYKGYLKHFYGPHYMELLPVSQRTSGHRIARIDLGAYLFSDTNEYRHVDLRGELYEREENSL